MFWKVYWQMFEIYVLSWNQPTLLFSDIILMELSLFVFIKISLPVYTSVSSHISHSDLAANLPGAQIEPYGTSILDIHHAPPMRRI